MIGQYLSNTNKIDTIHILQNILELNKAQVALAGGVSFYGIGTISDEQCGLKHYNATKVTIMTRNRSEAGKLKHKQKKLMLNLLLNITLLTYYQIAVPVMGLCTANMLQKQN